MFFFSTLRSRNTMEKFKVNTSKVGINGTSAESYGGIFLENILETVRFESQIELYLTQNTEIVRLQHFPLFFPLQVDAEPAATKFRWSFNSTPGISRDLTEFASTPGSEGAAAAAASILIYVPRIAADYGTLQVSKTILGYLHNQPGKCLY